MLLDLLGVIPFSLEARYIGVLLYTERYAQYIYDDILNLHTVHTYRLESLLFLQTVTT